MNRRNLIRLAGLALPAGLLAPRLATAADPCTVNLKSRMAGGVYLTRESPGRFPDKAGGHVPMIDARRTAGNDFDVRVLTAHEMRGYEHYIIKHQLLNWAFEVMDEHMFDPERDEAPVSNFTVTEYGGPLYALSMCNEHDVWLSGVLL